MMPSFKDQIVNSTIPGVIRYWVEQAQKSGVQGKTLRQINKLAENRIRQLENECMDAIHGVGISENAS